MERTASATWTGTLKDGKGELSSSSGVLSSSRYSFGTRFDDGKGTNPEELIGAAHAGCYSMALSGELVERGIEPERIDTEATVVLEKSDDGFVISEVRLDTRVEAPGADPQVVEEAAQAAKTSCIVSRLLDTGIHLDTTLVH
jgi:lipoyl-dependent peroxiredoxin